MNLRITEKESKLKAMISNLPFKRMPTDYALCLHPEDNYIVEEDERFILLENNPIEKDENARESLRVDKAGKFYHYERIVSNNESLAAEMKESELTDYTALTYSLVNVASTLR
jgi:hypothetical protein